MTESLAKSLQVLLPADGSPVGNAKLCEQLSIKLGKKLSNAEYDRIRDDLVEQGLAAKGKGRGGSLRRITELAGDLVLEAPAPKPAKTPKAPTSEKSGRGPKPATGNTANILAYQHDEKRRNNPEVGMVTPESDHEERKTTWAYDPHIDPALQFDVKRAQVEKVIDEGLASDEPAAMRAALEKLRKMSEPYLNWAGKAERISFDVDTVSLHVHERIDPATLLRAIRKRMSKRGEELVSQSDLFQAWFEAPLPYREAIDFYKHDRGWANRMIAGDSLLVMNSLLQKEGMAGQVQMIYIDPPYGITYGSNFQPFVGKREVDDGKDEDLTKEPEMIKAFRDTWQLGIHSYLTYLRDRLIVARQLLADSGSVFVQISDENHELVRNLCDEIFGRDAFVLSIVLKKKSATTPTDPVNDFIVWYAKNRSRMKVLPLIEERRDPEVDPKFNTLIARNGEHRRAVDLGEAELAALTEVGWRWARVNYPIVSQHPHATRSNNMPFQGTSKECGPNKQWRFDPDTQLKRLVRANRVFDGGGKSLGGILFWDDWAGTFPSNIWSFHGEKNPVYVVQTSSKALERCVLLTTEPGDLVIDPTCGSGTTALVAEKWGRRWITCDTSRVAITLAKQRLMTASFDYFDLAHPQDGIRAGFINDTMPRVTLGSIGDNIELDAIWQEMHPAIVSALSDLNGGLRKARVPPFTPAVGGRKGTSVDFTSSVAAGSTLPSGDIASNGLLLEWEVPTHFPSGWPQSAREPFDSFHAARLAMQLRMEKSIASHAGQEVRYDRPQVAKGKLRVTGPFTMEAVPFPSISALNGSRQPGDADASIARSGESARQHAWKEELLKAGVRGKGGQVLMFAQLETLPGSRYIHCTGNLADSGERVVVSFGPEYAALEQRQVELAKNEASDLFPTPKMLVFCAFTFDPEAAKDIDAIKGVIALKVQMNTDLLTDDLQKAKSSNQSFWLMGQPDVDVRGRKDGKYEVEVNGFDYFDTIKGELVSGGKGKIAMWLLDTDYDERSLLPRQVFFPMAGAKDGWYKLKNDIKAELNESLLERLHGTVSIPFEAGENKKIAVKIVDDRGIESLKVISLA